MKGGSGPAAATGRKSTKAQRGSKNSLGTTFTSGASLTRSPRPKQGASGGTRPAGAHSSFLDGLVSDVHAGRMGSDGETKAGETRSGGAVPGPASLPVIGRQGPSSPAPMPASAPSAKPAPAPRHRGPADKPPTPALLREFARERVEALDQGATAEDSAAGAEGSRKAPVTHIGAAMNAFTFDNVLAARHSAEEGRYVPVCTKLPAPGPCRAVDSPLVSNVDGDETPLLQLQERGRRQRLLNPARDLQRQLQDLGVFDPTAGPQEASEHSLEASLPLEAFDNGLFESVHDVEGFLERERTREAARRQEAAERRSPSPKRRSPARSPPPPPRGARDDRSQPSSPEESKAPASPPRAAVTGSGDGPMLAPAVALRTGGGPHGGDVWETCGVEAFDSSRESFTVVWDSDGTREDGLPRILLCFAGEDTAVFAHRYAAAVRRRRRADALLRYNLYVDCMPTDDAPQLNVAQIERVMEMVHHAGGVSQAASRPDHLIQEVNAEMARAMNRIVFDMHAVRGSFADVAIPPRRQPSPPPYQGTATIPAHPMFRTYSEFTLATSLTRVEVIAALEDVHTECQGLGQLPMFDVSRRETQELEEFRETQQMAQRKLEQALSEHWLALIRRHLRSCLADIAQSSDGGADARDFDLDQRSLDVYQHTKLARLLRRVQLVMEDSLRDYVAEQMAAYVSFVEHVCVGRVTVRDCNDVAVDFSHSTAERPQDEPSLFVIKLMVQDKAEDMPAAEGGDEKKEKGEAEEEGGDQDEQQSGVRLLLSTEPDAIVSTLPRLFDTALRTVQDVQTAEQAVMERLPLKGRRVLQAPGADEQWLTALRARCVEAVERAVEPVDAFVHTFDRFLPFLAVEPAAFVEELEQRMSDNGFALVQEAEALVLQHQRDLEEVKRVVPETTSLGLVEVDSSSVRKLLIAKHEKMDELLRSLLARTAVALAQEATEEYGKIFEKLCENASNVEQLTNLHAYMDSVPGLLTSLEPQRKQVGEVFATVDQFHHQIPFQDFKLRWRVYGWPKEIHDKMDEVVKRNEIKREQYMQAMKQDQDKFETDIEALSKEVQEMKKLNSLDKIEQTAAQVQRVKAKLAKADEQSRLFNSREALFDQEMTEYDELERLQKTFEPFCTLWEGVYAWQSKHRSWMEDPLLVLDPEEVDAVVQQVHRDMGKTGKAFAAQGMAEVADIAKKTQKEVEEFRPHVPLIQALRNPGMKDRHWEAITKEVGFEVMPDSSFTLTTVFELRLQDHLKVITKIGESAGKEFQIEKALNKMAKEWESVELDVEPYRETGTYILHGVDEVMALLDEHITMTQAMSFSAFKKPFEERIEQWEKTLSTVSEVIEEWVAVQRNWLYLQPIFDSPDINRQLPKEGKMFKGVDKHWRSTLKSAKKEPKAITFCDNEELLEGFRNSNATLDIVQKGLSDYLETKRGAFARFYFLSNDELLEILSETKDPTRVQPHLSKCFEAIKTVDFEEDLSISVMNSQEGERVSLMNPVITQNLSVEVWMNSLEDAMRQSVKKVMCDAVGDYTQQKRTDWILHWPGMCVLNGSQVHWTAEIEEALNTRGNDGIRDYYDQQVAQLNDMVELVRGDLGKLARTTIGALAVIDVHARDVTKKMVEDGVSSTNDFLWLSQLRYYWEGDGMEGDLWTMMVTSKRPYGYEYLGNSFRLVITPLTDKCYLTLMGALQMVLGGAPAGPAGTGKTETTKDLAKALAKQCVVFNCSDGMDYKMTGKFFKGLASCGAWACFDEFNRITIEVLSVIAQQIMTLQRGVVEGKNRIVFEETDIHLSAQFAVFITMNPGYAGRTDLPDNLKALFRPVAMMVPDYALIGEIMLFSFGFANARLCARKMVATFRLCSEQLSSQSHYDYGMRAVKTVIVAAGNLKRAEPEMDEEVLLLRALIDVNLPKFLAHDLPLFRGIMSDLFPGKAKPAIDYGELLRCIKLCAQKRNLQTVPFFLEKCIQLYEMIVVRHGLMVVGPTMGAKSSNIFVLRDALTMLAEKGVKGERFEKVQVQYLNPKSITMGQLYGEFDPNTHEWQDGVLANMIRVCAKAGTPTLKWVLFDGPVDTLWIESMNTVLDDNKKLCLNSGEIVALSNEMTMMFEPADLAVASPATVSRCGMVYMEPTTLGFDPLFRSWLESLPPAMGQKERCTLTRCFDTYVRPAIQFMRRNLFEPTPTVSPALVNSLLKIMDCYLADLYPKEGEDPPAEELVSGIKSTLEPLFMFALIWSVAATVDRPGRRRFNAFLRQEMLAHSHPQPVPQEGLVYDYLFDAGAKRWVPWMDTAEEYVHNPKLSFSEMIIPTMDTVRYTYLLDLLIRNHKHVLMTGETGTGKSININKHLQGGMPDNYVPLTFTFSAQTSANQTQDIIDGKTEKRRKGVYGPPVGKQFVIFVDDVNMPQREIFFAQPPIELLRQWLCAKGWYDRKTLTWRSIVDSVMVLACGPPGGGRNPVTPRFFRHFNTITYTPMQDESVYLIFHTILSNFLQSFEADVQAVVPDVVRATIDLYNTIVSELLPTPAKPHYTFNMRDVGKVVQGMLMCDAKQVTTSNHLTRLWVHEARRVFRDRLINETDSHWCDELMDRLVSDHLGRKWDEVLASEGSAAAADPDARLLFGDYMIRGADPRVYAEVSDASKLQPVVMEYLDDFNAQSKTPMNLVMFLDAIEHVSRVSRVVRQPGGNALLLGVGGSGRQSLTKLAAFMAEYEIFQVEIAKGYGKTEWREDLKQCLLRAGLKAKPVVFLFNDTQIVFEGMLEDINNVLNTGDVPNLYAPEETDEIMTTCRVDCQRKRIQPTKLNIFAQYLMRVRANIHVVLCMSPMGEAFRRRMRMFPSLVNCCTIDWFHEWPDEALRSVANSVLGERDLQLGDFQVSCVEFFRVAHQSVARASTRYFETLRRHNYVTPTSFLELLSTYQNVLVSQRQEVGTLKKRLQNGLDKLKSTAEQVATLQEEIKEMQPVLAKTQKEVEEMMVQIAADKEAAAETQKSVAAQEAEANEQAKKAQAIAEDAQRDLDEALPALDAAVKSLKNLKKSDLDEVKALGKPPAGVKMTMEATCIMFGVKPVRVADPNNPGKKIMDYWDASKKTLLANANKLLKDLMEYDKDNIPEATITKIEPYVKDPMFTPEEISKASKACTAICMWVHAMYKYHTVAKEVEPKRKALKAAQDDLAETRARLAEAKAKLKEVEDRIADLEANFEKAQKEKKELTDKMEVAEGRLERAEVLMGGLGGERKRWEETVAHLTVSFDNLVGDGLISAGTIAYLGAFTPEFRQGLTKEWRASLADLGLPHTEGCTVSSTLSDPVQVRQWVIFGLPTDTHSVENGIVMAKARRWPLLIDPQGQANRYIKNMGKELAENGMDVTKLSDKNFLRSLENGVRFGKWVLLENIEESLDAALEPLLLQQKFKQGGTEMIKLGDSTIPYNDQFRFFMTTKLPNPHYPPEVCVKVSLLNFTITPSGLEDQLLGLVVVKEMPELEERKNELIKSNAAMKAQLKEIEDKILYLLSNSTGNILDDVELIDTLAASKKTSEEINAKVAEAEETEKEIDASREGYRPVAFRGSVLYFCISDFALVDPMYQYSLQWFQSLFDSSVEAAEPASEEAARIANLIHCFTYMLYTNVCRSLFERHKLLFSFLMTIKIQEGEGGLDAEHWRFLISGQAPADAQDLPNPAPAWMVERAWTELCTLSSVPGFSGLAEGVAEHVDGWKEYFDSSDTHRHALPGGWEERISPLQRLCVLRCLRPDRIMEGVLDYVVHAMGQRYVEPPPFDLAASFEASAVKMPLIFVLSAGSDPTKMFADFAQQRGFGSKYKSLSLGQGQDRIAEKMVETAAAKGMWVYLQNCHLYTSWLPKLEQMIEAIDPASAHPDFRLWLTSMPTPKFPTSILQNGVKMTLEPPKGLRANLKNAYYKLDDEQLNRTSKPRAYRKLLFALSFFHAVVQDRRKFGPLGWNIPYEFNESDLEISRRQLELFLDRYEEVPYRVLNILTSYINYGGRVTDYIDLRTIDIILRELFCPEVMRDDYKFSRSGIYYSCPVDERAPHASYMEYIDSLPMNPEPEVFGMHSNANIISAQNETYTMFDTILSLQPRSASGGGLSREEILDQTAARILEQLAPPFDTEAISLMYPLKYEESMNTVLLQECIRYNGVLLVMHRTLPELRKALKGLVVMSGELEAMSDALFTQRVPEMWEAKAYPSLKPLHSWVQELVHRLAFLNNWIDDGIPPSFWISGFFFPQAFLTGTLQNYARKHQLPIDTVSFSFKMLDEDWQSIKNGPEDGVYIYGLFLEGARWSKEEHSLVDSRPKQLYTDMPTIHLVPEKDRAAPTGGIYRCPVYKILTRRGSLSTTGHSTNFVMWLEVPSNREDYKNNLGEADQKDWVKAGVAAFCSLRY